MAVAWGPNRLDLVHVGANSGLWHKSWNGRQWSGYENLAGGIQYEPEICSWDQNRLDIFVVGNDSAVYHKYWNGTAWGPQGPQGAYEKLGGIACSKPVAVCWDKNRIDIFVIGTDRALYHKSWNGSSWGPNVDGWERLGGTLTSAPEVVSWGPNRLDIFGVGTDSAIWHKWWDGTRWGPSVDGWENLGGAVIGQPKAACWGPNRIDLFVKGMDSGLWHKYWDGSRWGPDGASGAYEKLGGIIQYDPAVVSWAPNRLDIFVVGTDFAMYHKYWNGSNWGPNGATGAYERLGGTFTDSPKAVSWASGRLDIFGIGLNRGVYHKYWDNKWGPSTVDWESLGGTAIDM